MNGADSVNGGTELRGILPSRMLSEMARRSKDRFETARNSARDCDKLPPRILEKLEKARQHSFYHTYLSFHKDKNWSKNPKKSGMVKFQVTN